MAVHQEGCSSSQCGGDFECVGCRRMMGWCFGGSVFEHRGAEHHEHHCDDCYVDRYNTMALVSQGINTMEVLEDVSAAFARDRGFPVLRTTSAIVEELVNDGLLHWWRYGPNVKLRLTDVGFKFMKRWNGAGPSGSHLLEFDN